VQKLLRCHEYVKPRCCKWSLWVEECVEGWVIKSFCGHDDAAGLVHNHELVQSREEANARASMRSMPEEHMPTAKSLVSAGLRVSEVVRWLRYQVEKVGEEVSFNYQDVYNATSASAAARALNATNFVEDLRQREQDHGLFYRTQTDDDGCLKNVFFAMHGAHEIYAVDAEHQVVELDTKVCCVAPLRCAAAPRRATVTPKAARRCHAAATALRAARNSAAPAALSGRHAAPPRRHAKPRRAAPRRPHLAVPRHATPLAPPRRCAFGQAVVMRCTVRAPPTPRRFASRRLASRPLTARHEQRGAADGAVGHRGQHGRHQDPRSQPAARRDGGVVPVLVRVLPGLLPQGARRHLHGQRPRH
jgi:hypothetical protein